MSKYFNRELSWLKFNERVLEEAFREDVPLSEKIKFLSIFSSNLDEFFMVRVAGMQHVLDEQLLTVEYEDLETTHKTLRSIRREVRELCSRQYRFFVDEVLPALKAKNVSIVKYEDLSNKQKLVLEEEFESRIKPVLTPLAIDPGHPAPFLSNLEIYLVAKFKAKTARKDLLPLLGLVQIPKVLPRFIRIATESSEHYIYIKIEDLIAAHIEKLFLGFAAESTSVVRITRNLDYQLLENEVVDLLAALKKEITQSHQRQVVRLEVSEDTPDDVLAKLIQILEVDDDSIDRAPEMLSLSSLMFFYSLPLGEKYKPFNPRLPASFSGNESIFAMVRKNNLLLHHPYDSFYPVVEFLSSAAEDPDVIAIKQTLYRTSGQSPIVSSLIKAAEKGKQVTAVIELKARFDETNNIEWARRLEEAGVNVVYGFVGLKTHVKATLITRREKQQLRQYAHMSTGNYNSSTAKFYTDISLLSANKSLCTDIANLFNFLTGFNVLGGEISKLKQAMFPNFKKLVVAPLGLRQAVIKMIHAEIKKKQQGEKAYIAAKMNSLVDKEVIQALYEASKAGVKIDLIVRGICRLKPGVKGLSDNIKVISIIDRFLEHSRVFYFRAGGLDKVFISSADWMPRNFDRRIEALIPIETESLKTRLLDEVLGVALRDNSHAWQLLSDGSYKRVEAGKSESFRSQEYLIEVAREQGVKSVPYDKAIKLKKYRKAGKRPLASKKT